MDCCSKGVNIRRVKAWSALDKVEIIWKSALSGGLEIGFFLGQRLKRSSCMDRRLGH